ncbi:MAG TPA: hypothetical protein VKY32_00160 [Flavobacterium sp.]|nr:hypothetical protein [Flavobacterium sp.]
MKKLFLFLLFIFGLQSFECNTQQIHEIERINNEKYQLKNEKLIFTFQTKNGKILTICMDKNEEYIVYRFGTSEQVEMEYPEQKDKSSFEKFEYSGWMRGGGVRNEGMRLDYLAFSVNHFKYVVYDTYFAVGNKSSTGIKVINTQTNKTTDIKGIYETLEGNLSDFRFDDRIKKGEELYD